MSNTPPSAKPGDICVLLTPLSEETDYIWNWQSNLQTSYGGMCTDPVHITCQRFDYQTQEQLIQVTQGLQAFLDSTDPMEVIGIELSPLFSPFHKAHILKCKIRITPEIENLGVSINRILQEANVHSHFPWTVPDMVTVLEDITPLRNGIEPALCLPYRLFTGCCLILSRIIAVNHYEHISVLTLR